MAAVSALEAIVQTRTSQGAIAWGISLIAFPLLAVPLYIVFGRNRFSGYMEQRALVESDSHDLTRRAIDSLVEHFPSDTPQTPMHTSLSKLARLPATNGNHVELLIDGENTFDSIAKGMQQASKYILFQFYILRDDQLGRRLGEIMIERAAAGVEVFVLFDEIGSHKFGRSKLAQKLRENGVYVTPFNTTQGRSNRFQLNFRNHRKIVIVDGNEAWIGGHNVGDEYMGRHKRWGHWRDTHIHLRGPAVVGAEMTFAIDWHWATRTPLALERDLSAKHAGDHSVLIFPSDPASEYEEASLMFHQIIVAATQRIWISTPYFVPDQAIVSALQLAALRGVDVRILIPDRPEGLWVGLANWSFTRQLAPAGINIYRYQGGTLHQKVLLMDGTLSGVGTANFDNRSFRLNFEITVLVENDGFAEEVEAMFEKDWQESRLVTQDELDTKPRWFPLATGMARLLAPVL